MIKLWKEKIIAKSSLELGEIDFHSEIISPQPFHDFVESEQGFTIREMIRPKKQVTFVNDKSPEKVKQKSAT